MKTTGKKGIAIIWMVVFAAGSLFSFATNPSKTATPVSFIKEIREDAASIQYNEQKIETLLEQCVAEREDGDNEAVMAIKTELAKAKAEIKMDKKHMKASKRALVESHKAIIRATREQVRDNKSEYREMNKKVNKDVNERNEAAWAHDVFQLSQKQKELSKNEALLEKQEAAMEANVTTAKRIVQDAGAEFRVFENTFQWIEGGFASNRCY